MTIEELLEIETLRRLRLRYSYFLDTGQLDALADLFTEDAVCEFGPYGLWRGRETIRANYHAVMGAAVAAGPFQSLHANTNHWVELTGAADAVGRLYLIDLAVNRPADVNPLIWAAVYDEAYRKEAGGWRIARSSLQFLWPERHVAADFPGPAAPFLAAAAAGSPET